VPESRHGHRPPQYPSAERQIGHFDGGKWRLSLTGVSFLFTCFPQIPLNIGPVAWFQVKNLK
jgi:hypothetical protein